MSAQDVKKAFPRAAAFQGFCPVTYVEQSETYEALVQGLNECAAEYAGEIYLMASPEQRNLFMRRPTKYHGVPLPQKRPARMQPVATAQLPNLGFMEQTCATVVTKACQAVGLEKPKFPFLTTTQSALVFVALYLKAENPK